MLAAMFCFCIRPKEGALRRKDVAGRVHFEPEMHGASSNCLLPGVDRFQGKLI